MAAAALLLVALTLNAPSPARADEAASPFVLAPDKGLYEQFGYAPAYTRNVPAFDGDGRAYIRSRTSSGAETSYIHTLEAGSWVRLDFLAALRAAYPGFVSTLGAAGLLSDGIVFDRENRAYNPITVQLRDGTRRNALLVSWDRCRSWKVFTLPSGTFTIEHSVGHNEIDGPPFLAVWRTSAAPDRPGSQTNVLFVTQPRLEGDRLVIPPLVQVSKRCLGLSRDSGGASFAVTKGDVTWFVWSETARPGKGGTPHYVSTYYHSTNTLGPRRLLATSPQRSDQHNKPGICLDGDGYLHVIAGGHGSPALYTRSLAPLSADSGWTTSVPVLSTGWVPGSDPTVQLGRQTYPSFVCDGNNVLHLITRQWRRGVDLYCNGQGYAALVHQSCPAGDTAGGTWSEPNVIVAGSDPGYGVFFHKVALDTRNRLFVSCSYQGGPELREDRSRAVALAVLGRTQLRPGKYRRRMLLVSADAGTTWRFATDADLAPAGDVPPAATEAPAAGPWASRLRALLPDFSARWLNPKPVGNQFTSVSFGDRLHGWAVGTHGTVFHTLDGGVTWSPQTVPTVADLYGVAARGKNRVWAVGAGGTILSSTNGGATWKLVLSDPGRRLFGVCAVTQRDVWIVGERGWMLRSTDGGRNWIRHDAPTADTLFAIDFVTGKCGLLCDSRGGLYRTGDGGWVWKRRRSNAPSALFAIKWLDARRAAAVGQAGAVIVSDDGGWNWRRRPTPTDQPLRALALRAKGRLWALGPNSVLRSSNFGKSWSAARLPVPGPCGAMAALTDGRLVAGGAGGALCTSRDGGRLWRTQDKDTKNGLSAIVGLGSTAWIAGAQGTLLTADGSGEVVFTARLANGASLTSLARQDRRGWAVGANGTVATTTDGGMSWATLRKPTDEDLNAVAAPGTQTVVVAGRNGTLLTSTNAGVSWMSSEVIVHDLLCLSFSGAEHGWAGGGATFGEARAEIARTVDGGVSWQAADLPLWGRVRGLSFLDNRIGWAVVEDWGIDGDRPQGAIMATADGGDTWVKQATSAAVLTGINVAADGIGYAWGEQGAVLRTIDSGAFWQQIDVGTDSTLRAGAAVGGEQWLAGDAGAVIAVTPE